MTDENHTATENNQVAVRKEKTPILAGTRGVQFSNMEDMWRFCVAVVNSHQFGKDIDTPEVALIRLQAGMELGLSPIWSLTNIMVVNGRPSVWGDAALGLCQNHPDFQDCIETFEGTGDQETAICEVRRKGRVPVIRSFSVSDVKRAKLDQKVGSVHVPYPRRMRQMRARSFALRDSFADVLRGLGIVEEMRDVTEREPVKPTEKPAIVLPDEVEGVKYEAGTE